MVVAGSHWTVKIMLFEESIRREINKGEYKKDEC